MLTGQDLLPGVPPIESPFFAHLFDEATDAVTLQAARSLAADGVAVIDLSGAAFHVLADRIRRSDYLLYDWAGWQAGTVAALERPAGAPGADALALATEPAVLGLLARLYGREPFAFETVTTPAATAAPFRSDALALGTVPERFSCGVWLALEDVGPDQGPMVYYPGSHRWPVFSGLQRGRPFVANLRDGIGEYDALWAAMVEATGVVPQRFYARKGQAVIWAANLLHGVDRPLDKRKSRFAQVTRYAFRDCAYVDPIRSDPAIGSVAFRSLTDLATGAAVPQRYGAMTVPDEVVAAAGPLAGRQGWATALPPDFDGAVYLALNPDVAAAGLDPAYHFSQYGRFEERSYRR